MTTVSVVFHLVVFFTIFLISQTRQVKVELPKSSGPVNVMWARTVKVAKKTPKYKLPGPRVAPEAAPAKKVVESSPAPKKVVEKPKPTKTDAKAAAKLKAEEEARKQALEEVQRETAMSNALASVSSSIDDRPAPKADNFPSPGDGDDDITAGPGGGMFGIGPGDPVLSAYKEQVRQIITNNFVTLQKNQNLVANVEFKIDRAGNILDPKIRKPSGNSSFDSAALRAVTKSSPLPPPDANLAQIIVKQSFVIVFDPKRMANE